jgi:hypothetical protein
MNVRQPAKDTKSQDRRAKKMADEMDMKKKMDETFKDLSNKEKLLDFFRRHQIVLGGEIQSLEPYERGEDRGGVIVSVKDRCLEDMMKVLIDVKWGQPCID